MERNQSPEAGGFVRASKKKKRQGNNMKKGFSDEQIRLLETMFETETKPEPRKKVELARELGLQPRQVAIWFQNRRARWKSKQLEQEYRVLKCSYDKLLVEYESLKKEKQSLRLELQKLSCMLGRACDGNGSCRGTEEQAGEDNSAEDHDTKFIGGHECFDRKWMFSPRLLDGTSCKVENSAEDRCELLNMGDEDDGSMTAVPEKWCNFGFSEMSDYSCTSNNNTHWWNFCT